MKRAFIAIIPIIIGVLLSIGVYAQAPERISYQAIIRNSSNELVKSLPVGLQVSILQGSATGSTVFSETHSAMTNINGLLTIEIGGGTPVIGSLDLINWTAGPYFLKTETDPLGGTAYSIESISQLMSVPFALHAKTVEAFEEVDGSLTNELQTISLSNDTIYLTDGGFVKISRTAWSVKGNAGTSGTDFIGTNDNVPFTIKVNNQRSARLEAGSNHYFGYEAGLNFTSGTYNTGIGYRALSLTNNRSGNTAIGARALENNTNDRNTAVGFGALQFNTSGQWNTALGSGALISNISGSQNVAIGGTPLQNNQSGSANIAIGSGALLEHQSGNENIAIGMYALKVNFNGINNVALGTQSGHSNSGGSGNLFLGHRAGYNETGSNKLYIANSEVNPPLIYGDFTTGKVGIGTISPAAKLEIAGAIKIADGSQAEGKVLTSDSDGLASWQDPAGYNAGEGISIGGNTISVKNNFYLGQDTLGGIVYYIYRGSDGAQHGLIVSKSETTAQWQSSTSLTGAIRSWDGEFNMTLITNSPAKTWVSTLGSEWYLPSIDELALLWQSRFHVNRSLFAAGETTMSTEAYYWSSTEFTSTLAFSFGYGNADGGYDKTTVCNVRAVKGF